jgi:hypothetical protein
MFLFWLFFVLHDAVTTLTIMNYRIRDGKVIMNEAWGVRLMKVDVEYHKVLT